MLELKLNHVSKRGQWSYVANMHNDDQVHVPRDQLSNGLRSSQNDDLGG